MEQGNSINNNTFRNLIAGAVLLIATVVFIVANLKDIAAHNFFSMLTAGIMSCISLYLLYSAIKDESNRLSV